MECIELGVGADEERVESLWIRIKGQTHTSDVIVGVYYRPPDQEEEVDEAFQKQLQAASQSQALCSSLAVTGKLWPALRCQRDGKECISDVSCSIPLGCL